MKTHLPCMLTLALCSLVPRLGRAEGEKPPLIVSIESWKPAYEVAERTRHSLKITNQSSQALTLPSLRFLNVMKEDAEIAFYVKEQVLHFSVMRGKDPVPINKPWRTPPKESGQFPTVQVPPGESISASFSLTRRWEPSFYSLPEPGEYSLTVILDTTRVKNDKLLKGRFASAPVTIRVVPAPTFRDKEASESQTDYARARVAFYLDRIEQEKGEYFPNVADMLKTQDAPLALIEALDSKDRVRADRARAILKQAHHGAGLPDSPATPRSGEQWMEWWNKEGSRLSPNELWSNVRSHSPGWPAGSPIEY